MQDKKQKNKKLSWSHLMTDFLIVHYKKYACLYDKNHVDYNSATIKMDALNDILKKMHQFFPHLELKDVEDKIQSMHTELAEEMACIEEAEASFDKYEPKLYCYEQLQFLRPHITPLEPGMRNITVKNPLEEDADYVPSEDSEGSQPPKVQIPHRIYCKTYKWTRQDLKKFIKSLYKYNVLCDSSHKNYLNRQLRFIAYKKLLKETQKIDPQITLNDIRVKLKCLRNQYLKEVRQVKRAQENNKIYEPVLWCFGLLLNLYYDEFGIKSYSKLVIDDTSDDDSFTTTHPSEVKLNNNKSTPENELFEEKLHQDDDNEREFAEECATLPTNNSEDVSYAWLGELVISQLEEISQNYHTEFAWDVQCLLREYILKSNAEADEPPTTSSSGTKNKQKERINIDNEQQPPSNVSFNISFL